MEFVVVHSPSWLDENWSLGLISRNSTARYLTNEHEGQRINFLSDTLPPPVFDIYASWTFLGYPFLRKWCHRRLRYNVFELPFVSWDVEAGHKSTRMYIGFYSKPQRVPSDFNWCTTDILIRGIVSTHWYHCPKPWMRGSILQKFKLLPTKPPTNLPPTYVPPTKSPNN